MKTTKKCPICNEYFLNEPMDSSSKNTLWRKTCNKKIDHILTIHYDVNTDIALNILISNRNGIGCLFLPKSNAIELYKNNIYIGTIDYFKPDFSNISNLFKKIKLYTIMF